MKALAIIGALASIAASVWYAHLLWLFSIRFGAFAFIVLCILLQGPDNGEGAE